VSLALAVDALVGDAGSGVSVGALVGAGTSVAVATGVVDVTEVAVAGGAVATNAAPSQAARRTTAANKPNNPVFI
jgi:hypothetical protein